MSEYSVAWYFDRALERGAYLLDESNFQQNVFPLFRCLQNELKLIARGEGMELGYSYPGGKKELRGLIAEHESFIEGQKIDSSHVVVNSCGCTGTFDNIFRILSKKPRRNVVIPVPCYPEILTAIKHNGLSEKFVPTYSCSNFEVSADSVCEQIDRDTALVFLTSPGNPVCQHMTSESISQIARSCEKQGCYLVIDTVFEEAPGVVSQKAFASADYERAIKIKSFSKDRPQMNDLRLGWSICYDSEMNAALINMAEVAGFSNSTIIERLAIADMALRVVLDKHDSVGRASADYIRDLTHFRRLVSQGMQGAREVLASCSMIERVMPSELGNLLFAKVASNSKIKNSHDLFMYVLHNKNILISPGNAFRAPDSEIWFRITMAKQPQIFVEKTKELVSCLEDLC